MKKERERTNWVGVSCCFRYCCCARALTMVATRYMKIYIKQDSKKLGH